MVADEQLVKQLGARLMEMLLGNGYHVYVDNWYANETLFLYLFENITAACTARKKRLKLPATFKDSPLAKGSCTFRRDNNLLAVHYHDKKEIYLLSTIHKANLVDTRKRDKDGNVVKKLQVVDDYNKFMVFVDRNDVMNGTYSCLHKSMNWRKKWLSILLNRGN